MVAELHGKISSTGSNLSDRLEDKLTGDIFGSLRYLPFDLGMAQILSAARIPELSRLVENAGPDPWVDRIFFWPWHPSGELDVRIDLDDAVIGIEVKYRSPLSSEDEADYSGMPTGETEKASDNQLARESAIVRELAAPDKQAFLILVADDKDCASIFSDVTARNLIADGVTLGRVSWQEILLILESLRSDVPVYSCILRETAALLKRKGFERFHGFDFPVADIRADEYFTYQYSLNVRIHLPEGPLIDGGSYYEFG